MHSCGRLYDRPLLTNFYNFQARRLCKPRKIDLPPYSLGPINECYSVYCLRLSVHWVSALTQNSPFHVEYDERHEQTPAKPSMKSRDGMMGSHRR
jgi:hypothetical protein